MAATIMAMTRYFAVLCIVLERALWRTWRDPGLLERGFSSKVSTSMELPREVVARRRYWGEGFLLEEGEGVV